jgi:sterol desaturase/sphingolipid hydroxylase (fatty acid hydroxylase superfamily)
MIEVLLFLSWTLLLYVIHRLVHITPILKQIHWNHHRYISLKNPTGWKWNNLFLYNDTNKSTLDLWITEVVPTLLFSYFTGHWWIFCFYYIWAAFIQERIEHDPNIDFYPFTSGRWHLIHHKNFKKNYGLFHPFWDRLFRTEML